MKAFGKASSFKYLMLLICSATVAACGGGGSSAPAASGAQTATPPAVTPPAPTPPAATSRAATLSWTAPLENSDGSVLLNLSGFKIYYGQNATSLTSTIAVGNPSISTYIVEGLGAGTWYFGVSAVNGQGIESPLSNIASKTIS